MERLQQSSTSYVKSLSRRDQGEGKEKHLPVGHFANVLIAHGDDFEPDSEFGMCLTQLGRANERIARMQETYVANATSTWIEGTERTLAQMKEYQKAKQKLESRRLALDTAQVKLQKSKREDFRAEEELRSQKAKYEETSEDVYRRMFDIKEAEADSIADLTSFLEAELTYYDRCREVLLQIKREWPAYVLSNLEALPKLPLTHFQRLPTITTLPLRRRITQQPPRPPRHPLSLQHSRLPHRTLQPNHGRRPPRTSRQNQFPHPLRPKLPPPRTPRLRILQRQQAHPKPLAIRLRRPNLPRRQRRQHTSRHAASQSRAHRFVADLQHAPEPALHAVQRQRLRRQRLRRRRQRSGRRVRERAQLRALAELVPAEPEWRLGRGEEGAAATATFEIEKAAASTSDEEECTEY